MVFLPQELVYAIADEIEDIPSLKALALAGSPFRDSSQRILLRSFTVKQNIEEAHTLLEESPHIAAFIARLVIRVDWLVDEASIEKISPSLHLILGKMVNVRQCILRGTFLESGIFTSALLDFLARQPLRELNVLFWDGVPAATIQGFLTIAPIISFSQLRAKENPRLLSDNPQHKPKVEDLFVGQTAHEVCDLLAQPRFGWGISTLRRLAIPSLSSAPAVKLLVATTPTLEHLHLGGIYGTVLPPTLPLLRSIHFSLDFPYNAKPWFWDLISSTLTTSPLLTSLIISLEDMPRDVGTPNAALLTNLDIALAVHPRRPAIRLRLDLERYRNKMLEAAIIARFAAAAETGMPNAHEERRLVVEEYACGPERWRRSTGKSTWTPPLFLLLAAFPGVSEHGNISGLLPPAGAPGSSGKGWSGKVAFSGRKSVFSLSRKWLFEARNRQPLSWKVAFLNSSLGVVPQSFTLTCPAELYLVY
ncbi:hypothetical protein DFH08DRAFT_800329 [Mycena albidolilacea]|uniref:Uncharacterized protein n=1 Tax=Mycena albidolilacea TaxID=1033008 RepID=A0AAD7AJP7_9AGAR|nr:hypothetical protein DFH08DRAFT_800329 [Mycena albidolilacea]